MSRRLNLTYRCRGMAELARQLLLVPGAARRGYLERAEAFHDVLDVEQAYPMDFVTYRLTSQRPIGGETSVVAGVELGADLRLLIDQLSRSMRLEAAGVNGTDAVGGGVGGEVGGVVTVAELAERFSVSEKTLTRWRKAGLRWRWMVMGQGERPQVVFTESAVAAFMAAQGARVEKARRFTTMQEDQRQRLVARARRLVQAQQISLHQAATHLARRTGRAVETIRQLLEKHDREHPEQAIFGTRGGVLRTEDRRAIARAYRGGVAVSELVRQWDRTRSTIYRAIHERRAAAVRRLRVQHVMLSTFERADAEQVLGRFPADWDALLVRRGRRSAGGKALPGVVGELMEHPALAKGTEQGVFIRYNYAKYRAAAAQQRVAQADEPRSGDLRMAESWLGQARSLRHLLVLAHLPVVVSVARRHLMAGESDSAGGGGGSLTGLTRLLEVGIGVLAEAVEAYDMHRGSVFEAFLVNRLLQHYARLGDEAGSGRARARVDAEQMHRRLLEAGAQQGLNLRLNAEKIERELMDNAH